MNVKMQHDNERYVNVKERISNRWSVQLYQNRTRTRYAGAVARKSEILGIQMRLGVRCGQGYTYKFNEHRSFIIRSDS